MLIEDTRCFECGTAECIQHHHVVPRSVGGSQTIPLCSICHGKVHGIRREKQINISELTKAGLERAKARGVVLGNSRIDEARLKSTEAIKAKANRDAEQWGPILHDLYLVSNGNWSAVVRQMNSLNIPSPRGKKWNRKTTKNIVARWENLKEKT
jgi:hypothetical protein